MKLLSLASLSALSLISLAYAEEGFTKLFDGETLAGWTDKSGQPAVEGKWLATEGVLHRAEKAGNLYTAKEYRDFDFRFEWKISEAGNSGVKYRLAKYGKSTLGPEYQILDIKHRDGKNITHRAGALYDLLPNSVENSVNPVGQWNSSRIVAQGHHFQHYLNGKLIVDVTVGSELWKKIHAKSKFKDHPNFATNPSGLIYLQDHNDEVWYRNLRIKELNTNWSPLFNGKDLTGWSIKSGNAKYTVEENTIVGTTEEGSPNTFLITDKQYDNFELEFETKVHNTLNSGVMIRALLKDLDTDKFGGRIFGPQVEVEASREKGAESGYIFGEATGRGWLTPKAKLIPHKTFKDGEWNHFRVVVNDANIKTWINGKAISDLSDEAIFKTHPKGHIGLQIHSIGKRKGPFTAAWRNLKIKELK